jgi:hypothetical protein
MLKINLTNYSATSGQVVHIEIKLNFRNNTSAKSVQMKNKKGSRPKLSNFSYLRKLRWTNIVINCGHVLLSFFYFADLGNDLASVS